MRTWETAILQEVTADFFELRSKVVEMFPSCLSREKPKEIVLEASCLPVVDDVDASHPANPLISGPSPDCSLADMLKHVIFPAPQHPPLSKMYRRLRPFVLVLDSPV
jgi:hypothetical protein